MSDIKKMIRVNGESHEGYPKCGKTPTLLQDFAICSAWMGGIVLGVGKEWDPKKRVSGYEDHRVRLTSDAARELARHLILCADELDRYALTKEKRSE